MVTCHGLNEDIVATWTSTAEGTMVTDDQSDKSRMNREVHVRICGSRGWESPRLPQIRRLTCRK